MKIIKNENPLNNQSYPYLLVTEEGIEILAKRWYEKSKDKYHVLLPDKNPSGRRYVVESVVLDSIDKIGYYELEVKTEGPRVFGSSKWIEYLSNDEKAEYDLCKARMDELEKIGRDRVEKAKILDKFDVDKLDEDTCLKLMEIFQKQLEKFSK